MRPRNSYFVPAGVTRVKLVIAFDGGAYDGWQRLRHGTGVQQVVEGALTKLFPGGPHLLQGSSRTDAGVHALGLAAHADLPLHARMTPRKLLVSLNAFLPEDIRVLSSTRAPKDFHARFHAVGKEYRYTVWNHAAMNPLLRGRAWHVSTKLDFPAMKRAARLFEGRHDFRSFTANRGGGLEDAVRTLKRCRVTRGGSQLTFAIEGSGFLYRMCRGIVGTLVQLGQGKFGEADIRAMLAAGDRRTGGMSAPAEGLVLWKVRYAKGSGGRRARSRPA
ncbi:MAG TPA: tRNA pseudouridine(38-40) synthase TruA [Elusimicrobiota bacterium]|nr:tRNA pseudouridine(38-40) synthase TruA [Elusimicrobiota bacterium]